MLEKIKDVADRAYGKKIIFFAPLVIIIILILLVGVVFLLSGFSSYETSSKLSNMSSYSPSSVGSLQESYVSVSNALVADSSSISVSERKVIKNANLNIVVAKIEDTLTKTQSVAAKYNGLVDNSSVVNGGADTRYGSITIKVPNDNFDTAISEIKKLAIKVNSEKISSEDVTAQYFDLEARLKSKKAVEDQYVALLKKANDVKEIVSVSSYLNTVREEIERLQAQINYLSTQVAMSSINISLTSEAEVQIFGITWHPIVVVKQSFRNFLSDMTGIIDWLISFLFALPGFLIKLAIFLAILWIVVKVIRKIYRKIKGNSISSKRA